MSGKRDKASAEDLHVMDTVEQYETYEDYLDSQVRNNMFRTSRCGKNAVWVLACTAQ